MLRIVFVLLLVIFGTASYASAQQLDVSNFRSGVVCPEREPVNGAVCVETTDVPMTGRGVCIYAGVERPCTWYGFEFEYANARPEDVINCVVTTDHPVDYGDPYGRREQNTYRAEFSFKLPSSGAGRFFNPQYTILDPRAPQGASRMSETVCSFGSRELFRYQMRVHLSVAE